MKIIIKSIAIILFLLHAMTVMAKEPIIGAFGAKLGDTFNPEDSPLPRLDHGDESGYVFEPTQPYEKFEGYVVAVTPITNVIYGILGIGRTDADTCKADMDVLVAILSEKYGELKDLDTYSLDLIKQTRVGSKVVSVICRIGVDETTFEINYKDLVLAEQAEKERIKLESEKVNKDGL